MESLLFWTLALLSFLNYSVHGAKCACEAQKHNFAIDCDANKSNESNTTIGVVGRMMDAFVYLQTNGCSSNCSSEQCEKNFMIFQSHYDHCPEDSINIISSVSASVMHYADD